MSEVRHTTQTIHTATCGLFKIEDSETDTWLRRNDELQFDFDDMDEVRELHAALTKYIELAEGGAS